jgi:hypothetical protein
VSVSKQDALLSAQATLVTFADILPGPDKSLFARGIMRPNTTRAHLWENGTYAVVLVNKTDATMQASSEQTYGVLHPNFSRAHLLENDTDAVTQINKTNAMMLENA